MANTSDFIFTASPTADDANRHIQTFKDNGVNHKIIHSSDAHEFADDVANTKPRELGHCFTWVKADTTFEGLKQVIYDYPERIKIQTTSPYDDDTKYVFDAIKFDKDGIIKEQSIPINRDLISIIGSKGSGKSLLLSALSSVSDLKDNHSQQHPIFEIDGNSQLIHLDLKDKDGNLREKHDIELGVSDENYYTEPILYIKQEELAERSKQPLKVRKEYLRELGIEDLSIGYQDITDDTQYNLDQIDTLYNDLSKVARMVGQETIEGLDEYVTKKISSLEETNKKLSNEKTRGVVEQLSGIIAQGQEARLWSKDDGFKDISLLVEDVNERIGEFNEKALALGVKQTALLPVVDTQKIDEAHQKASTNITEIIDKKRDEYTEKKKELEGLGVSEDIPTLLKTIEGIQRDIATHKKAKEDLDKILTTIPTKREYIGNLFGDEAIINNRIQERVIEIDDKFSEFKDERKGSPIFEKLFSNIDIKSDTFFNYKQLEADIAECFYKGKVTPKDVHELIFGNDEPTYAKYFSWIKTSFWDFLSTRKNDLMERLPKHSISGNLRLLNIVLLNWYDYVSVSVKITHQFGQTIKEIGAMSTGELATVLLKLILVTQGLDKQIILLDQPEDHLDNEFIANDLVELIRVLKKMRQIIMVTHNANLVVMTDSEQVIVAKGLKDGYISGGIENPDIRDCIIKILEGGSEAFKKRYKRYGNS